ncbi:hypothetical protein Vretimale_13463 [Volvox reticuliferus]|uniref:Right handed beta helix domain-containing protein n=1 Tax=Volvox reticuliferus TaxID=1737510 RepID=A0A8J4LSX7_9CHLO|nr:hypothetical protein Vretifemale_304 [Volvox reticuliferus]GIM09619.1 hypothetical protein Vretimale_13463 [Volvox reticuliferus]
MCLFSNKVRGLQMLPVVLLLVLFVLFREAASQRSTVLLVTGRRIAPIGGNVSVYNDTREASISTQLISSFPNGISYWWNQSGGTFSVGGENQATQYRSLLRFEKAHRYVPQGAVVEAAELTVTFVNWNAPAVVQACFMRKNWSAVEGTAQRFTSTGWLYYRWNGTASVPWTRPGGWADCAPEANISFVVPTNNRNGYWVMTVPLDPGLVAQWLSNGGRDNYGLMFRGMNGSVLQMVTSMWKNGTLYRPALSITYNTSPNATAHPAPNASSPVNLTSVPRTWWVGPTGDDDWNSGHEALPLRSPAMALTLAWPGDSIYLMTGTYGASLSIYRANLTIRSGPGHWAVLSSPLSDPRSCVNVITIFPGADYGTLRDLEIVGGYYYGIMFFTSWNNWSNHSAGWAAPSHWVLQNLRIHDTGSSNIKMSVKAVNNTVANCEFYNAGARLRTFGNGIDIVQGYDISISDSYFHDLPSAAVLLSGGTARVTMQRNFVERTDRGFELGSWTDTDLMDQNINPGLYEAVNNTVRNNIVSASRQAGIVLRSALNSLVVHNTVWRAQEAGQAAILLDGAYHVLTAGGPNVPVPCAGAALVGNLVVTSPGAMRGPMVQIRGLGLDTDPVKAALIMSHNIYYNQAGLGPTNGSFYWGTGAMLEDQRSGSKFVGNATGWAAHCSRTLQQPLCDINSTEADPQLGVDFVPLSCSPARNRVPASLDAAALLQLGNSSLAKAQLLVNGTALTLVQDDFHARPRPAGAARRDAGAVQSDSISGALKALPPVPSSFAMWPPYRGIGLGPMYDKTWPYNFWQPRVCKDIVVDSVIGNDSQSFDYYSGYAQPFKTLAVALTRHNMCDRIFLRASPGQWHVGGVTVTQTNLTIATYPADAPARAALMCTNTSTMPCLFTYGSATAITVTGIDIVMAGPNVTAASCIHMNEGAGSGTSFYWSYFSETSGRPNSGPLVSTFKDLTLTNCGVHGIKLSTFVSGVVLENINITNTSSAGITVVGGAGITIRNCRISNVAESGIRMGGGVRNVLVEGNLIRNYGGVGILLGSEATSASYTDADWARLAPQDWHECINATVRNNIVDSGAGAGVAFYSARDATVVHNSFLNVAASMHAAVLLNVSPKQIGPAEEVGPANTNITFKNNIVTMPAATRLRFMVQTRILQGSVVTRPLVAVAPSGNCSINDTIAVVASAPPSLPPSLVPASPSMPSLNRRRQLYEDVEEEGGDGDAEVEAAAAAAATAAMKAAAWSGVGSYGNDRAGQWRGPGGASVGAWDEAIVPTEATETASGASWDETVTSSGSTEAAVTPAWYGREASGASPTPLASSSMAFWSLTETVAAEATADAIADIEPAALAASSDATNAVAHESDAAAAAAATAAAAADTAAVVAAAKAATADAAAAKVTAADATTYIFVPEGDAAAVGSGRRRRLKAASFTDPYVYATGEQGRNPDGSCPFFPDTNPWHQDVSGLSIHPRSEAIKSNIGFKNLHLDFGFSVTVNGTTFPAGMPINFVNSSAGTPRMPIVFGPSGYGDPNELEEGGSPIPPDAAVQGAFPGCGDPPCWGDRHLIVIDNATCTLYEAWRSFPPSVTGNGTWQVEALLRFNMFRNALDQALGATSADAAGLPIMPGLLRYEEVVRGYVDHALRFTGPNSRPAYAMPGTHYAAAGYTGRDAPYMAMRVRLKASYNCSQLARAAQVVCEGLKKYGAFFADNGLPWDFAGEGTSKWYPIWNELKEVMKINSTYMEVIDPGCICVNPGCTIAECNGMSWVDPNAPQTYPSIADPATTLHFANNIYYKPGNTEAGDTLYVDQRVPPLGPGYASSSLAAWGQYLGGSNEAGSLETDPQLDPVTYAPLRTSVARCSAPLLSDVTVDFYGRSRGSMCGTDVGAVRFTG